MLYLSVLGPIGLSSEPGMGVPVRAEKPRLVLARLVVARGASVSVDALHHDIWMGRGSATVVKATVGRARQVLGDHGPSVLVRTSEGYRLDLDRASLDATRFEHLLADAVRGDDPERTYAEAMAMWHGDAFADCDAVWVMSERRRLGELRVAALVAWLEIRRRRGDPTVLADLIAAAEANPLHEELVDRAGRALREDNRNGDALQLLHRHRRRLRDDFGLEMSPSLIGLERLLFVRGPGALAGPRPGERRNLARPAFTGRDDILAGLAETTTEPRAHVVTGAPGVGKTSLVHEHGRRAHGRGENIAIVACPMRPDRILGPIAELCERVADQLDPASLAAVVGERPAGLRWWVPALERRLPEAAAGEPVPSRDEMLADVVWFLAHAPFDWLVVDDAHWADDSTLQVLARLVEAELRPHLVVVGRAVPDGRWSRPLLGGAARVSHIALEGLDTDEVREIVLTVEPGAAPDRVVALAEASGGNPLFLVALLATDSDEPATSDIAPTVTAAVESSLEVLDARTVEALEVAAIAGNIFSIEVVTAALGDERTWLDGGVLAGLVTVSEHHGRFRHHLVADVLRQRILPLRRAQLHEQVGLALQRSGAGPVVVAHHLAAAADLDPMRAVDTLRAAAAALSDGCEHRLAAERLTQALALVDRAGLGAGPLAEDLRSQQRRTTLLADDPTLTPPLG